MEQGKSLRSFREAGRGWLETIVELSRACGAKGETLTVEGVVEGLSLQFGVPVGHGTAIVAGCEEIISYGLSAVTADADALHEEEEALLASRRALRPVLEARLQTHIERVESAQASLSTCGHSECGAAMTSRGRRKRSWQTTLGEIELCRRWSTCQQAGHGPGKSAAQEQLLLPAGRYSARLSESLTMLATAVPHGMACQLSGHLLGVEVSEHGVQEEVHDRARTLMGLDDEEASQLNPFEVTGLEREVPRPPEAAPEAPEIAYLEVDGVFPITRQLDESRSAPVAQARGGKGRRYTLEGKEVKNAVLYTAKACAQESQSRGCLLEKRYVSVLGAWMSFALLLWVAIRKLRFDEARLLVVLSDGAHWIRELAQWLPCSARVLLVLDLYHAIHRVYEVASAVFGDTLEGRAWKYRQKQDIEEGRVDYVIDRLRFLRPTGADATKKVVELITYFDNNRDRMDYPEYRRRGLRISSAAVESANYHVTGARLKGQGMRWEEDGAAEMARLRADLFNESWERRTREALAA
jgi:hypothetical protein